MKLAVYSESATDEAVIRLFVDAIRGTPSTPVDPPRLAARGWPSVREILPTVIGRAHWQGADALAVVVDSDGSEVHTVAHDTARVEGCRVCDLQLRIEATRSGLAARPAGPRLLTAVGLPVPAIEAWLLAGEHRLASEAAWAQARQANTHHQIGFGSLARGVRGWEG